MAMVLKWMSFNGPTFKVEGAGWIGEAASSHNKIVQMQTENFFMRPR